MATLIGQSQGATGPIQATQAGHQLLALQSQQLSDLIAVMSTKGRAAALSEAERDRRRAGTQAAPAGRWARKKQSGRSVLRTPRPPSSQHHAARCALSQNLMLMAPLKALDSMPDANCPL
ncbi:P-type conjugative transfer protein TrbJ [Aquabacter spiritensis]|uniref:P-type conjugative transfer protein TrbJ n=1 Tax=Aquabacter spiritensis TaxID=933073 RepID=A0A4R3LTT6_9HYPH|nr:P-type conjugative transfer protein TrbJ [Aquabacter spiritensis]